jgi:glycosyltransferase involved in cell wall biosynthesis
LVKNGGIGTANTGLALTLAEAGCHVTVLFANRPLPSDPELRRLQTCCHGAGIQLEILLETPAVQKPFSDVRSTSYAVYLFLREREFDVVYFHECRGLGFYPLVAKFTGCFPSAPLMLVLAYGPSEWRNELNARRYYDKPRVIVDYLERRSVELADALISPSQHLIDWMTARAWKLPTRVFVEKVIVRPNVTLPSRKEESRKAVNEIVFFGRNEVRKGLALFCDAIDLLKERTGLDGFQITFLGRFSEVYGLHSGIYMLERSATWEARIRVLAKLDRAEALGYLGREGILAVMPSLQENSPCAVAECLELGIPFLATDGGGTAELIEPGDRARCLVQPNPAALAERLWHVIEDGHRPAKPAISQADIEDRWRSFHGIGQQPADSKPGPATQVPSNDDVDRCGRPLVSICLALGTEFPGYEQTIETIAEQSYRNYEVIVVVGESWRSDRIQHLRDLIETRSAAPPVRVISNGACEAAAARQFAATQADGQFLLFLDERDAILLPDSLEVLVTAAIRTGADVMTGLSLQIEYGVSPQKGRDGALHAFPIGACPEVGIVENCYGDGLVLVDKHAFEGMGGFTSVPDDSPGYWHFLSNAVTSGLCLELVPQTVLWHRGRNPSSGEEPSVPENDRIVCGRYGQRPVNDVGLIDPKAESKARLDRWLTCMTMTAAQRELALGLSALDPNSEEAIEGFLHYSSAKGRSHDAADFALSNDGAIGAAIRWTKKETAIEFDWPFAVPWELELQTGTSVPGHQAARVVAYLGDRELSVRASPDENGGRLRIPGIGGASETPVNVRIFLPYSYRLSGAVHNAAVAIDRIALKAADREFFKSGAWRSSVGAQQQVVDAAMVRAAAGPTLSAPVGGQIATAKGMRLDERYVDKNYRHLDVSVLDVALAGAAWANLKFKFCLSRNDRWLEFRKARAWPSMFTEFPGNQSDAHGPLWLLSLLDIPAVSGWKSERDKLLLQAVMGVLPTVIARAVDTEGFPVEEQEVWRTEAAAFSSRLLFAMREHQAGVFAPKATPAAGAAQQPAAAASPAAPAAGTPQQPAAKVSAAAPAAAVPLQPAAGVSPAAAAESAKEPTAAADPTASAVEGAEPPVAAVSPTVPAAADQGAYRGEESAILIDNRSRLPHRNE